MKIFKQLAPAILLLLAINLHAQQAEAPIQKVYEAPETEQERQLDEDAQKPYTIGSGAIALILAGIMLRKRMKKKKNANKVK